MWGVHEERKVRPQTFSRECDYRHLMTRKLHCKLSRLRALLVGLWRRWILVTLAYRSWSNSIGDVEPQELIQMELE